MFPNQQTGQCRFEIVSYLMMASRSVSGLLIATL